MHATWPGERPTIDDPHDPSVVSRRRARGWIHAGHAPGDLAEAGRLVEVPLPEDRRPGHTRVVLHGIEVDSPGVEGLRGVDRHLVERYPRDGSFHGVTV